MLFDLQRDPDEFIDLAKANSHSDEIARLYSYLAQWGRRMSQRVTRSDAQIIQSRAGASRTGIMPFLHDGSEVPSELTEKLRGPVQPMADDK